MSTDYKPRGSYSPVLALLFSVVIFQTALSNHRRIEVPRTASAVASIARPPTLPLTLVTGVRRVEEPSSNPELSVVWDEFDPEAGPYDPDWDLSGAEGGDEPEPEGFEPVLDDVVEEELEEEVVYAPPSIMDHSPVLGAIRAMPGRQGPAVDGAAPLPPPPRGVPPSSTYEVKKGDTLEGIARNFNVHPSEFRDINGLTSDTVEPGMVLTLPIIFRKGIRLHPQPGAHWIYETRGGETLTQLGAGLDMPVQSLAVANKIDERRELPAGIFLKVPQGVIPEEDIVMWEMSKRTGGFPWSDTIHGAGDEPRKDPEPPVLKIVEEKFLRPVKGKVVSPFGWRFHPILHRMKLHTGVDMRARMGQPIRAARSGKVILSGWHRGYGKTIDIRHADDLITRYAHCSRLVKRHGQMVAQNEIIAYVGSTGRSTGPHLHFEVRRGGRPLNPMRYLASR